MSKNNKAFLLFETDEKQNLKVDVNSGENEILQVAVEAAAELVASFVAGGDELIAQVVNKLSTQFRERQKQNKPKEN